MLYYKENFMSANGKKNNLSAARVPTGQGRQGKKPKIIKLKINASWKNILLYGLLLFFMLFIFMGISQDSIQGTKSVPISQVISDVKAGKVSVITV